jgi:hypothetical protein
MTTTTTLNGDTNPAIYKATNEINPQDHAWPKVTVRETTDAQRAKALAGGTRALASIVAAEERKLRALKAMLDVARAVSQDPKALSDADSVKAWGCGLDALNQNYDEAGVTQTMMDLGDAARRAERLAIVSGHAIFAAGGSMTEPGSFVATSRSHVAEQIAEHGEAA